MDETPAYCDWRGSSSCTRRAAVELVYPSASPNHGRRRLVCRRHAEIIVDYCAGAGLTAPSIGWDVAVPLWLQTRIA
ncbi:MAG: hypothetical protein ACLQT7_09180 [Candidatus Dormibacteria bacterium]